MGRGARWRCRPGAWGSHLRHPPETNLKQAGFTLLEMLVALVVLGFILAGLAQGTRYGLRAVETQARLDGRQGELDAVDRALRRLIGQADPGDAHSGPPMQGSVGRVGFVSRLPAAAAGFVAQDADVALGVSPDGRLVLRWTPHLHAQRFGPAPPASEVELLRGVARLELGYFGSAWRSDWDARTLPTLVRVRIVFPPGDARHWPDLVVATMRQQPR